MRHLLGLAIVAALIPACGTATTVDSDGGHDIDGAIADANATDSGIDVDSATCGHHCQRCCPNQHSGEPCSDGSLCDGFQCVLGIACDAGPPIDAWADAAVALDAAVDAGPACEGMMFGACPSGVECLSCPTGPIMEAFLCTTHCTTDADCTDSSRPHCSIDTFGHGTEGICTPPSITCRYGVVCASPDTMIATPSGERLIADLVVGDLVYSADEGMLHAVPLSAVFHTPVTDHRVVHVVLETGRVLEISPGHPTADGRSFGDLRAGDRLDGTLVVSAELVPYLHGFTYDILPASDTATYVAGGALIGSTLATPDAPVALERTSIDTGGPGLVRP
jgi:hypothetical protein